MMSKRLFHLMLLVALFFASSVPAPARSQPEPVLTPLKAGAPAAQQAPYPLPLLPAATDDVPDVLSSDYVSSFTIADPVAYWHTSPEPCPPSLPSGASTDGQTRETPSAYKEGIGRTPTYGGAFRWLYHREVNCGQTDLNSNLVADGQYIYWISVSQGGLVRLSKNANTIDTPELMVAGDISGRGYLTQLYNTLYFLKYRPGTAGSLFYIDKSTFATGYAIELACFDPCGKALVTDDFYYVVSGSSLYRFRTDNLEFYNIEDGINGFDATSYTVWFAKGNGIYLHENFLEQEYPIYFSPDPTGQPYNPVLGGNYVFFFESRNAGCQPFACYNHVLVRKAWEGSGGSDELVFYEANTGIFPTGLEVGGAFLFYQANGVLYRIAQNAAALPKQNMWITGMEVTQGIQTVDNQVGLIENRRTFVRVYARSESSAISGVTAYLYRTTSAGAALDGPLVPINPAGQRLTVIPNPNRNNLDQSFLFEIPWSWTTGTQYFYAVVNPTKLPLEPNYSDNGWPTTFPLPAFNFRPSPRLETLFVSFGYTLNNQNWYPSLLNDIIPTYSYIRRTYPLSSSPGMHNNPSPGFRPNLWLVLDDGLGTRVNQTDASCTAMAANVRSLCASGYVNSLLRTMRTQEGIADGVFMYGMISDRAGFFPRGQEGGSSVSSGPAGAPAGQGFNWDTDTTYADWYAAHEIGHSLGRDHPVPNSDDPNTPPPPAPGFPPPAPVVEGCGHSRTDNAYPYQNAELSPAGGGFAAFDAGDRELGLPMRFIPGNTGHDVMSYCNDQWLSDYTYRGIYRRLMGSDLTKQPDATPPQTVDDSRIPGTIFSSRPKIAGDFLSLAGIILPDNNAASLQVVRRLSAVASIPDRIPGEYSIRLLNTSANVLADYPFTPEASEDAAGLLSFHQVVDFTPGTAEVEVVRLADGAVLDSRLLSANPPMVGGVSLVNPPNPVTGTVTLSWNAVDPDGDALSFDLFYSRDSGLTFIPVRLGVQGASAQVDTGRLGGSDSAIFRVTATDGANLATADSPPFAMASKPPAVRILTPEDGLHIQYGQIFNLAAEADDPKTAAR